MITNEQIQSNGEFGIALGRLLNSLKSVISRSTLSKYLGVTESSISQWTSGKTFPDQRKLSSMIGIFKSQELNNYQTARLSELMSLLERPLKDIWEKIPNEKLNLFVSDYLLEDIKEDLSNSISSLYYELKLELMNQFLRQIQILKHDLHEKLLESIEETDSAYLKTKQLKLLRAKFKNANTYEIMSNYVIQLKKHHKDLNDELICKIKSIDISIKSQKNDFEITTIAKTSINCQTNALDNSKIKNWSSIVKVIGVGGGGSNAVNHMFAKQIEGVNYLICNTDAQAIAQSKVPNKIQLGPNLTYGLGSGANPSIGRRATEESLNEIKRILEVNTKMAFITAGMGGGTGTGGAPILAKICKDLGILTVGIVTTPFAYEGKKRIAQAEEGIMLLKNHVDTLLVISNDKMRHQFGNLKMKEAFAEADNVLATAAKCITDVINSTGQINVDFADVCTVMTNGGVAILGSATAAGEHRALKAIENAINSPLLNDNDIHGAKWILININSAEGEHEFTMDEVEIIQNHLLSQAGENTDIILGLGYDNSLGSRIGITLIATGFEHKNPFEKKSIVNKKKVDGSIFMTGEIPIINKDEKPIVETKPIETIIHKNATNALSPRGYLAKPLQIYVEEQTPIKLNSKEELPLVQPSIQKGESDLEMQLVVKSQIATLEEQLGEVSEMRDKVEELRRRAVERIAKLRNLSFNINAADPNNEFETVPAYLRRNMELHNSIADVESFYSNYIVKTDENNQAEISTIKTFLDGKKPD